uniref:Uncharacterized protein n=1 Tax=Timema douglasi TaxID=61478 RepID=A0A7R8ZDP9_TIMDO|nr:unnamed protein product [Timema douglasi]
MTGRTRCGMSGGRYHEHYHSCYHHQTTRYQDHRRDQRQRGAVPLPGSVTTALTFQLSISPLREVQVLRRKASPSLSLKLTVAKSPRSQVRLKVVCWG